MHGPHALINRKWAYHRGLKAARFLPDIEGALWQPSRSKNNEEYIFNASDAYSENIMARAATNNDYKSNTYVCYLFNLCSKKKYIFQLHLDWHQAAFNHNFTDFAQADVLFAGVLDEHKAHRFTLKCVGLHMYACVYARLGGTAMMSVTTCVALRVQRSTNF